MFVPTSPHGHRRRRRDGGKAFFREPEEGVALIPDDLAVLLAGGFLTSVTSGQDEGEDVHEQFVVEEIGGPFVVTYVDRTTDSGNDESRLSEVLRERYLPLSAMLSDD